MIYRQYINEAVFVPVNETVIPKYGFTNCGVVDFGNNATRFRKVGYGSKA